MGQLLSIPMILIGIALMVSSYRKKPEAATNQPESPKDISQSA
jgi:prolipoprotein diacylglyceryltransferase